MFDELLDGKKGDEKAEKRMNKREDENSQDGLTTKQSTKNIRI